MRPMPTRRQKPEAPPGGAPRDGAARADARTTTVVESFEADGRGKGRHHGRVVLTPQAYPGEAVAFRVDVTTKGALQGRVVGVLRRSPDRVPHPCAHEFHCTGCPLLSYRPEAEARFKVGAVRRALSNLPSVDGDPVRPLLKAASPFGYRAYGKQHFASSGGRVILGSYVQGTHRVADNRGCPVLVPELARVFDRLADLAHAAGAAVHVAGAARGLRHAVARRSRATGRVMLVLATSEPGGAAAEALARSLPNEIPEVASAFVLEQGGEGNVLLEGDLRPVFGPAELEERLFDRTYLVGPRSFFQVNLWGAETIFATAAEFAGRGGTVLELFSGVGALTLPLAARFERVVAVEASADSSAAARANAARNDVRNVDFHAARAEEAAAARIEADRPDAIVADPPRKGLGEDLARRLAASSARTIVLLSCDPRALARDAAVMTAAGRRIAAVQPVDQFPRTAHVEVVTRFE